MKMNEIAVKVAVGAITAMAAGVGSILGSEGAKAGIKALMNRKTEGDPTPDTNTAEIPTDMTATNPEFLEGTPTNEAIVEEPAVEVETEEMWA